MTLETPTSRCDELIEAEAWGELAESLCGRREPGEVWLRTLARNLASMKANRPALYATVRAALPAFSIEPDSVRINPETTDSRAGEIFFATQLLRQHGRPVALAGMADGSVLRSHARFPPVLILGRTQEIVLIEPDINKFIAGLGCTDLTGPRGAFEQGRIHWYVGPDWADAYANDLIHTPSRMPPTRADLSLDARPEINDGLEEILQKLESSHEACRDRVWKHYEAVDDDELLAAMGGTADRKPRALLITSRFTSVLQYSTNDSADAMRELGWDVKVIAEPELWHSTSPVTVLAEIDSFKPDLVFQIDHLRYEMNDVYPPQLPFVCWIQDHFVNLTSDYAAASIGERDFVLTGATYRYVTRHGYPRRQCIDTSKSSRPPVLPASWNCDREDVFYVSNCSGRAEMVIQEICVRTRDLAGPVPEKMMYECSAAMMAVYERGESLPTIHSVRSLIRNVFDRMKFEADDELEHFFVDVLWLRLNNVLYRQQALVWTGEIADELGLKFGIYGKDWDVNPALARYARGMVGYGPELEKLTRESKILLQLEPYACYSHQRMLDALLAGGFTLVRGHPLNTLPVKIRQFLDAYVPSEIISVPDALESLAPPLREEFQQLLGEAEVIAAMGDVVDVIRGWQKGGVIGNGDEVLPSLDEITFNDKQSLRDRIIRFTRDDTARNEIAAIQREAVMGRYTYRTTLQSAMTRIHGLLVETVRGKQNLALREAA